MKVQAHCRASSAAGARFQIAVLPHMSHARQPLAQRTVRAEAQPHRRVQHQPARLASQSASTKWFAKRKPLPRLISQDPGRADPTREHTVYTVRLATGQGRKAGIDEPGAGVFVCLVGKDGASYLKRISPLYNAEDVENDLRSICEIADREAGANCPSALRAASASAASRPPPKPRFQPGSIDEVCFLGPELGPLAGLLVGPQAGSWVLEEAHVSSSRSKHIDRFVCREALGKGAKQPAAYLTAVPEGSIVYGSGSSSVVLTKEQAAALHAMGMLDYGMLKSRLTLANAALVFTGTCLCAITGGLESATPFAAGGAAGLLYQLLLQRSVDTLPSGTTPYRSPASSNRFMQAMGSGYARFTFIVIATLLSIHALDLQMTPNADAAHSAATTAKFFTGAAGFLMFKVAILGVSAVPNYNNRNVPPRNDQLQTDQR